MPVSLNHLCSVGASALGQKGTRRCCCPWQRGCRRCAAYDPRPDAILAHPARPAVRTAGRAYGRHGLAQQAAAISFRVLFSLVPLLALVVYAVDLVLPAGRRQALDDWIVRSAAGSANLEHSVRQALAGVGGTVSVAGAIALVGLLWAASGMMGSIRAAFLTIWESERGGALTCARSSLTWRWCSAPASSPCLGSPYRSPPDLRPGCGCSSAPSASPRRSD